MGEIQVPSHWKEVSFGEVCSLRKEPVQPTDNPDIAYVGLEHIDSGHPKLNRVGIASEVKSSKSKFCFGDILYGKLRPYLDKAVLADFEGICSTDILVFKANGLIKPEFLIYLVHTKAFINHAIRTTRGVNHPRTSWVSLIQFYFRLPPLLEQKTIAHNLRTIQKAKETRQRELELEREHKAALMQYLFTHGTRNEPLKQTEIGEIPESWEVVILEDMCLKIVDCPHTTPKLSPTGIRTVKNVNVRDGRFIFEPAFYTNDDEYTERTKRLEPKEGDVLFSREAPIGEACLVPPNIKLSLGQRLMLLRTNPEKLNNFFLVQAFYSNYLKSKMISLAGGVTVPHLNVSHVKKLKIPLPYFLEQHEIANILKACDRKIQALEKEITLLDELFHAMLEQLMIGKISTQPLTETYV